VNRAFVYLTALVGFGGAVYLAGLGQAQQPGGAPPTPPPAGPAARPTIAVFNMAAVMKDYHKAKYHVQILNRERVAMSGELVKWREQYLDCQKKGQSATDPKVKEECGRQMVALARAIEDKDREVNKLLNDKATAAISQLYDEIKTVVDRTAEMNGYHIVFAYPDGVTADDLKNPMLKELKLKPPAAQPFYVSKQVDMTGVMIEILNKWYPPKDEKGQLVDPNSIHLDPPATPGAAAAPGQGAPPPPPKP
jgi:Skp family chaperone for outer membrane proteins